MLLGDLRHRVAKRESLCVCASHRVLDIASEHVLLDFGLRYACFSKYRRISLLSVLLEVGFYLLVYLGFLFDLDCGLGVFLLHCLHLEPELVKTSLPCASLDSEVLLAPQVLGAELGLRCVRQFASFEELFDLLRVLFLQPFKLGFLGAAIFLQPLLRFLHGLFLMIRAVSCIASFRLACGAEF